MEAFVIFDAYGGFAVLDAELVTVVSGGLNGSCGPQPNEACLDVVCAPPANQACLTDIVCVSRTDECCAHLQIACPAAADEPGGNGACFTNAVCL